MLMNNEHSAQKYIHVTIMPMLAIFLMVAPFAIGLFNGSYVSPGGIDLTFERIVYSSLIWGAALLALLCIYFIFAKKFRFEHHWILLFVFVIPLSYTISFFNAASRHMAEKELLVSLLYAAIFLAAYVTMKNKSGHRIMQLVLMLSGYLIVLFGFFNLFGHVSYDHSVMLTDQGLRMTGIFQYANTYAMYLMIFLFCALHYIVQSRNRLQLFLHSLMLVPIFVSFLLTLSRGAWLMIPFVLVIVLPFYKLTRQIAFMIYFAIAAVGAFLISGRLDTLGNDLVKSVLESIQSDHPQFVSLFDSQALTGWGFLLLASAVVAGIVFSLHTFAFPLLDRAFARLTNMKLSHLFLPVLGLILGIAATFILFTENSSIVKVLPSNLQERVANITLEHHSVQERFTFYRDATKLISDYPAFGAGGGAWNTLYEKYQNNPYSSREAHSFFMQYMAEVGIVGFTLFAVLFGTIIFLYIRTFSRRPSVERTQSLPYFIIAMNIFIHSTIDFNMSFVYVGCLLFIALAGMASRVDWQFSWLRPAEKVERTLQFTFPAIVGILCIVLFVSSINHVKATTYFYDFRLATQQGPASLQELADPLDQAMKLDPNHPVYAVEKSRMLNHAYEQFGEQALLEENKELLEHYLQVDPFNRYIIEEYYNLSILNQDLGEALQIMELGLEIFPWEITIYDRAIAMHVNLSTTTTDEDVRQHHYQQILHLHDTVADMQEHLKTLPEGQMQGRDFELSEESLQAVQEVNALLKNNF